MQHEGLPRWFFFPAGKLRKLGKGDGKTPGSSEGNGNTCPEEVKESPRMLLLGECQGHNDIAKASPATCPWPKRLRCSLELP